MSIIFKTSEGESHEVLVKYAKHIGIINEILELNSNTNEPIETTVVKSKDFKKILEYIKHYVDADTPFPVHEKHEAPEYSAWEAEYIDSISGKELIDFILAVNFMCMTSLLNLCCKKMAKSLKNASKEQIKEMYGFTTNLTPEEIEEAKLSNNYVNMDTI